MNKKMGVESWQTFRDGQPDRFQYRFTVSEHAMWMNVGQAYGGRKGS